MFENNLKNLRTDNDLSQLKLSEKIGTSQQMIWKWEAGISTPNPDMLKKLANVFNVSIDYLLDNENTEKKAPPLPRNIKKVVDAMNRVDNYTAERMLMTLESAFPKAFEESQSNNSDEKIMYSYEWALDVLETHGVNMFSFLKDNKGLTENDIIEIAKNMEK